MGFEWAFEYFRWAILITRMENNWKWKLISNFIGIYRYYNESTIESDRLIGSTRRFPKGNKGLKIYGKFRSKRKAL